MIGSHQVIFIVLSVVDEIIKELYNVEFNYDLDLKSDLLRYWNDVKFDIESHS